MSTKTDEKVGKYIQDVKDKTGDEPDVDLLRKVTESCGPSIFRSDAETVSSSSESEIGNRKTQFSH